MLECLRRFNGFAIEIQGKFRQSPKIFSKKFSKFSKLQISYYESISDRTVPQPPSNFLIGRALKLSQDSGRRGFLGERESKSSIRN